MTNKPTTYTAVATIFYKTEIFSSLNDNETRATYKVSAESDDEAIAKFKEILSDNRIFSEALEFLEIGRCFDVHGHFNVYKFDGVPDYEIEDNFLITEGEDFEHYRKG